MQIHNEAIDQLALDYARGDGSKIVDLYEVLRPMVVREAAKRAHRATTYGVGIPAEDFESHFSLAVWKAAQGYDGRSHFMQRLRNLFVCSEADVWRRYRSYIRGEASYIKARMLSLDAAVNDEGATLGEAVLAEHAIPGPEDDITGKQVIAQAIEEFSRVNTRHATIIRLLVSGWNGRELAEAHGDECYTSRSRIEVHRARKAFRKFLLERYADDLSLSSVTPKCKKVALQKVIMHCLIEQNGAGLHCEYMILGVSACQAQSG